MILAFDTETTGLPSSNFEPHITQLSALLYNITEQRVEQYFNTYIQLPSGVEISPIAEKISGISLEMCLEKGRPIHQVLKDFYALYRLADTVVAHNFDFDRARIRCEIMRQMNVLTVQPAYTGMFLDTDKTFICTMKSSVHQVNGRWPKLIDLYHRLFGYSIDAKKLHNSFVDSALCMRVILKTKFHVNVSDHEFDNWVSMFSEESSDARTQPWRKCKTLHGSVQLQVPGPVQV